MIDKDFNIKLIDFGFSKSLDNETDKTRSPVGSVVFEDPIIHNKDKLKIFGYGLEFDLYSLGVLFYVILYGKSPFEGE